MLQEIITYLLVAFAFGYTLWSFAALFRKSNKSSCGTGACCSCEAKGTLLNEIRNGKKPFLM